MVIINYKFLLLLFIHINFLIKPEFNIYYNLIKNIYFKHAFFHSKNNNEKKNEEISKYTKKQVVTSFFYKEFLYIKKKLNCTLIIKNNFSICYVYGNYNKCKMKKINLKILKKLKKNFFFHLK